MFLFNINNIRYMQYFAAMTAPLSVASCAMYGAWTSPVLSKLTSDDSPIGIKITKEEASWIASCVTLGAIPASLVTPYIINKFGRKPLLLISALCAFIPWIIIIFAKSVILICIARILAGASLLFSTVGCIVYNGEIADKDIRGKILTIKYIITLSGKFFVLAVGPFVSYTTLNISCSIAPVIFIMLFIWMPESPYFLAKVGKVEEARNSLKRLSSNDNNAVDIEKKLKEIQTTLENETVANKGALWELLTFPEHRKALLILTGLSTFKQLSGGMAIEGYIQPIIEASNSNISPEISSIIIGAIDMPAAILSASLVDKIGRKVLLIASLLGSALTLASEGTYFYLQDALGENTSYISWLPTTGLVVYEITFSIGLASIPFILLGELFQTHIKGTAVSLMSFYSAMMGFSAVKMFSPISVSWGMHVLFWIYGGSCFTGAIFSFVVIPETNGKSFDDVQKKLFKNTKQETVVLD